MDNTLAAKPRGRLTTLLLAELAFGGPRAAWELSLVAGIESNKVYPLLRHWIKRGIVRVDKQGSINIYSVDDKLVKALQYILNTITRARELIAIRRALVTVKKRLGRTLNEIEEELLTMLAERLARGHPYMRIQADTPRTALDILASRLEARLRRRGLPPTRVALLLSTLEEIIEELAESGVIYRFWDARRRTLVLRLDQSLDQDILHYAS